MIKINIGRTTHAKQTLATVGIKSQQFLLCILFAEKNERKYNFELIIKTRVQGSNVQVGQDPWNLSRHLLAMAPSCDPSRPWVIKNESYK